LHLSIDNVSKFGYLGNLSMSRSSIHECRDSWTWKRSDGLARQVKNVLGCERDFLNTLLVWWEVQFMIIARDIR